MNIQTYPTAKEFLAQTGKYLAEDEARYGLVLGLAKRLVENPHWYGKEDPWFCAVGKGNNINTIAIRTPPHMVIFAYFSGNIEIIAEQLVKAVGKDLKIIPGVTGDNKLTDIFANLWCKEHGTKIINTQAERIYRLSKVNDVPLSLGSLRVATQADRDLILKWSHAFHIDTQGDARNTPETDIIPLLARDWIFVWEDGEPVSMALKGRPTDNGMTVGAVYTPPEQRGRGYATSCVAEASRNVLQNGYKFCTLYTNLANPTSNSIYMKIGYRAVCDSVEYSFEMP
jgi:uncharacterized protein